MKNENVEIKAEDNQETSVFVRTIPKLLNLRKGPRLDVDNVKEILDQRTELRVIKTSGDFYYVEKTDGSKTKGYVLIKHVEAK